MIQCDHMESFQPQKKEIRNKKNTPERKALKAAIVAAGLAAPATTEALDLSVDLSVDTSIDTTLPPNHFDIDTNLDISLDADFTIVQSGDTLSIIAQRHNVPLQKLLEANPNIDPNRLQVGQQIQIPKR